MFLEGRENGKRRFIPSDPLTLFATMSSIFPQEYSSLIFELNLELVNIKQLYFSFHLASFLP
jgi:hypothetical protein